MSYFRNRYLADIPKEAINYKNIKVLTKCTTEAGRIMPCRLTHSSRDRQKAVAKAVKHARYLALLPYLVN